MVCNKHDRGLKLYNSLTNKYGKKKGERIYKKLMSNRNNPKNKAKRHKYPYQKRKKK